jgi:hypothetical protein
MHLGKLGLNERGPQAGVGGPSVKGAEDVVASDDPEKAYLEAYAVARQAADAVDGLVGK